MLVWYTRGHEFKSRTGYKIEAVLQVSCHSGHSSVGQSMGLQVLVSSVRIRVITFYFLFNTYIHTYVLTGVLTIVSLFEEIEFFEISKFLYWFVSRGPRSWRRCWLNRFHSRNGRLEESSCFDGSHWIWFPFVNLPGMFVDASDSTDACPKLVCPHNNY